MQRSVRADMGYAAPLADRPIQHYSDPNRENLEQDWHEMEIRDAGSLARGASLREHGFQAIPFAGDVGRIALDGTWKPRFAELAIAAVKQATGASEVFLSPEFAHIRDSSTTGAFGPARFCHSDFTSGSAARRIAEIDGDKAKERLGKRFAAFNLWWLISDLPQDCPLALCDASTISAADAVFAEARFNDLAGNELIWGEVALFRYNPRHAWYFFPELRRDQMLIWAGYDSDPGFPSMVPHTAFTNPDCPQGVGPRINIDCRCLAIWE